MKKPYITPRSEDALLGTELMAEATFLDVNTVSATVIGNAD